MKPETLKRWNRMRCSPPRRCRKCGGVLRYLIDFREMAKHLKYVKLQPIVVENCRLCGRHEYRESHGLNDHEILREELARRARHIESKINDIEQAKHVSQETLQSAFVI